MRILLVYPEYPPTFWSFKYALPFINKKSSLPPLGLLTVASLLPESWEKKLVDENIEKVKDKDLNACDYVFISAMLVQKESSIKVIKRAKALGKKVIAGGPLFTTGYEDFPEVDIFILNEGEETIPLFLKDLERGEVKRIYTSKNKPDIKNTPLPDWSLINVKDYASLSIQISRGCPFNCEFCDIIVMYGRVPRVKDPEQIIRELDAVYNTGWRGPLFIVDDNFIGNKAKVKIILKEIKKWMQEKKYPFTLYTEASINLADDKELLQLMGEANFNSVFIGIETPDEKSLNECSKIQNTGRNLLKSIKIIQENGIQVQAGFILGFDTDTPEVFKNMVDFIQKSGIVTAMVGLLNALPETTLYKKLKEAGRLIKNSTGNNVDFVLNFIPKIDKELLISGYKNILNTIFSPENYYNRIITFLKQYKPVKKFFKSNKNLSIKTKIKTLFKSIWTFGIKEKGRIHFWKMLLWTITKKPYLFPEAISLSIYGYHFRNVIYSKGA
jgi:radical SAM superfamily enzyme YgiQ (UPF0313 family)